MPVCDTIPDEHTRLDILLSKIKEYQNQSSIIETVFTYLLTTGDMSSPYWTIMYNFYTSVCEDDYDVGTPIDIYSTYITKVLLDINNNVVSINNFMTDAEILAAISYLDYIKMSDLLYQPNLLDTSFYTYNGYKGDLSNLTSDPDKLALLTRVENLLLLDI